MRYFGAAGSYLLERVGRGQISDSATSNTAAAAIPTPQVNEDRVPVSLKYVLAMVLMGET